MGTVGSKNRLLVDPDTDGARRCGGKLVSKINIYYEYLYTYLAHLLLIFLL